MKRKKIIIIAAIIILVVLGIIFLFWGKKFSNKLGGQEKKVEEKIPAIKVEEQKEIEPEVLKQQEEEEKMDLNLKARNFIERVGSFSSDTKDLNLKEARSMMIETLFKKLQNDLEGELEANKNDFYGKTTKVISQEMTEFGPEVRAHFKADVQIQETKEKDVNVYYQIAEITFLKQQDEWRAAEMAVY